MNIGRSILLSASKNEWLKKNIPKFKFVRRAVKKFMPGEDVKDAIDAARKLSQNNIPTTFTYLGENITNLSEAENVKQHYLNLLNRIKQENLDIEISLKLTQLGFDISFDKTLEFFEQIANKAKELNNNVFIDIEDSSYVDKTIDFYKRIKEKYNNVGLCLQAYLYRTMQDIEEMITINPWIRLVKGAYNEPETVAFKNKKDVDENYFRLSEYLLEQTKEKGIRVAYATHDTILHKRIKAAAEQKGLNKDQLEFQMLYGIKTTEQYKLAKEGYNIRVLISYGNAWYPWYMRRLAERPANVLFVLKNVLGK